ncbi:hypothetical protein TSUD_163760 [Trifolium subterraneum]|uniref:laccase n=1 Tax=Trifolium subterraneum TaxID=3900 RepID=A0A2Z6N500_TRISU|nr:hypothetical protein TSUD_163760 [Trifolium subterraneum]
MDVATLQTLVFRQNAADVATIAAAILLWRPLKKLYCVRNCGEWFNVDPEAVINQALQTGGGPNVSDAYTINGLPGPFYNCSSKDTFKLKVKPNKTYLLRIINAALNEELYFSIANHTLTVVEADARYIKPFNTDTILITPGQTTNVLLKTKSYSPNTTFLMLARPYITGLGTFDNSTPAGVWFMHCHLEIHTSWGLRMAWIVLDGFESNQKLQQPPSDLPKC